VFVPPPYPSEGLAVPEFLVGADWFSLVVGIFFFNLVLSSFVVVTLPGIVFFPLSVAALAFRALLWGAIVSVVPAWLFLAALPTLILEGEAYVFAAVAGTLMGMSWVKPSWTFRRETQLSRWKAFRLSLGEGMQLYFWVVLLLIASAIVETATILLL
jgi:hypothetical protein